MYKDFFFFVCLFSYAFHSVSISCMFIEYSDKSGHALQDQRVREREYASCASPKDVELLLLFFF